jgi:hypothetical protein
MQGNFNIFFIIFCVAATEILCGVPQTEIDALYAIFDSTSGTDWEWKEVVPYGPKVILIVVVTSSFVLYYSLVEF